VVIRFTPVILEPKAEAVWLNPDVTAPQEITILGIHVKRDNRQSIAYSEELIFPIWTRGRICAESYGFTVEEIGRLAPRHAWSKMADIFPSISLKMALFVGFLPHLSPLGVTRCPVRRFPGSADARMHHHISHY
jgi:hypothetical protein